MIIMMMMIVAWMMVMITMIKIMFEKNYMYNSNNCRTVKIEPNHDKYTLKTCGQKKKL